MKSVFPNFSLSAAPVIAAFAILTMTPICSGQIFESLQGRSAKPAGYAPETPQSAGRLFNLQTGHAGAFYNCDGEEDKRNSPYICWKSAGCNPWYRSISDVLRWKRDRSEIAQRICDGAGACCDSCGSKRCGCAAEASPVNPLFGSTVLAKLNGSKGTETRKFMVREEVAGLLSSAPAIAAPAVKVAAKEEGTGEQPTGAKLPPIIKGSELKKSEARSGNEKRVRSASLLRRLDAMKQK